MRLMIIDDHAGVRTLIRELVATPDDAVYECVSGDDAGQVAGRFKPDWVTMDIRMPGIDGLAATRAIRDSHPSARVVIVTSFDQPALRQSAAAAGAIGFVVKENLAELPTVLRLHDETVRPQALPVATGRSQTRKEC